MAFITIITWTDAHVHVCLGEAYMLHVAIIWFICRLGNALSMKTEKNIKRETKAYSYEDQLWEAKVKEELAKKKLEEQAKNDIKLVDL